ncbi:MAG: hypothetical protein ABR577_15830 [Pyrinomonadaceae bacterium]
MQITIRQSRAKWLLVAALSISGTALSACQQQATTTNANVNTNANTPPVAAASVNINANVGVDPGTVINAREPERYRATYVLSAETPGNVIGSIIPKLSAEVARNGADHRVAVKLPTGEQIIFLDRADKRYVIQPAKKQYAELTAETTGFDVQRLMTPGQLVTYLGKQRGYERAGDEQINGRNAEKYRYASTAKTNTQAGDVKNEAFVYVDKETGLPLRSEILTETSNSIQGLKNLKIITELRDIQTDVDAQLFELPQGYTKATPEQVRQQMQAIGKFIAAFAGPLLGNLKDAASSNTATTSTTTTTTTTATPAPTSTP